MQTIHCKSRAVVLTNNIVLVQYTPKIFQIIKCEKRILTLDWQYTTTKLLQTSNTLTRFRFG